MNQERYLCFNLGTEEFGVPLLSVKEVLAIPEITPVPFAPSHYVGVMNLRGQVISIIDLRSKFGIKTNTSTETSVIICDLIKSTIGIIVDSINSVASPELDQLCPKPQIQGNNTSEYITAIYRRADQMILFIDIFKTLNSSETQLLSRLNQKPPVAKAS